MGTGERGEIAAVNRGCAGMAWHSELSGARAAAWQSIAVNGQSIGSEAAAAVTHNPVSK